ncbi:MAG: hypothetical protein V3T84_09590 [Phycisphaerales bacterium]
MSRSTKPKPWHRPQNIVLALLLAFVGWISYLVYWAVTVRPNPSTDYAKKLEELSAASQPPGVNGWPLLTEAARILTEVEFALVEADDPLSTFDHFDFEPLYLSDTLPAVLSNLRHTIAELRGAGAFDQLALAAQRPNAVRPQSYLPDQSLIFQPIPDVAELRRLARARIASMYQALAQGDADEAVAALDQTLYIAQVYSHQTLIIEQLVGRGIAIETAGRLRQALMHHQLDATTCARLLKTFHRRLPLGATEIALQGERLILLDVIQRVYSDDGTGGGRLLLAEIGDLVQMTGAGTSTIRLKGKAPAIVNLGGFLYANRTESTEAANDFFDHFIRLSTLSRAERRADPFDEDAFLQALDWRYMPLNMLMPALGRPIEMRDAIDCEIAGTIIMLALEQYRAQTGQYPDSLDELSPSILQDIPSDPFSVDGFVYRKLADDPAGEGYVLYSIGADGVDNNAATDSIEPRNALSDRNGLGLDFVLNALKSKK